MTPEMAWQHVCHSTLPTHLCKTMQFWPPPWRLGAVQLNSRLDRHATLLRVLCWAAKRRALHGVEEMAATCRNDTASSRLLGALNLVA